MQDTNSLQTINDLDQIIANQQQKKAAGVTGYIVWGLSIPPISTILSMYFANKKGVDNHTSATFVRMCQWNFCSLPLNFR